MNAVKIMLFLLIFNISLSLVSGLYIYNMQTTGDEKFSMEEIEEHSGETSIWYFVGGATFATIVGGAVAGAVIGYVGGKIPTAEGIAYGVFAGTIIGVFITSTSILSNIVNMVPPFARGGVSVIVGLFLGITGLLIIIGYIQLIKGGMKSYI